MQDESKTKTAKPPPGLATVPQLLNLEMGRGPTPLPSPAFSPRKNIHSCGGGAIFNFFSSRSHLPSGMQSKSCKQRLQKGTGSGLAGLLVRPCATAFASADAAACRRCTTPTLSPARIFYFFYFSCLLTELSLRSSHKNFPQTQLKKAGIRQRRKGTVSTLFRPLFRSVAALCGLF